jgi:hypothetical protein
MTHAIPSVQDFKAYLQALMKGYEFDVKGLYHNDGSMSPLPREASVIGKVVEISVKSYLQRKLLQEDRLRYHVGGDRTYPDLTFTGPLVGEMRVAVDVKCARRNKKQTRTQSAISVATYDATYFREPEVKAPNISFPYGRYAGHLAMIVLYDYEDATARNVEVIIVEKWRVATRKRASGTRCYVAAVSTLQDIRGEKGDFTTEDEFHAYWRSQPVTPKKARAKKSHTSGQGEAAALSALMSSQP